MRLLETELEPENLEQSSVAELVFAAQQRDRNAFGELVRRFERAVFATALRRVRNHAEAQELTQEVFMQALRKLAQLRDPECFGGWIRQITVRLAINRLSRRVPTAASEPDTLSSNYVDTTTPLTEAISSERARSVHDSLGRLRPLDRDTLVAFYLQGQSLVEMSNYFDSPVGTIKRRLHVARKRLARELEALSA
jgi:RNA polymerase sigma-70 factor (ECF subfamily)